MRRIIVGLVNSPTLTRVTIIRLLLFALTLFGINEKFIRQVGGLGWGLFFRWQPSLVYNFRNE